MRDTKRERELETQAKGLHAGSLTWDSIPVKGSAKPLSHPGSP